MWPSPVSFKRTLLHFWEMHANRASPSPWNDLFMRDYFGVCSHVCHALSEHCTVLAVCMPTPWHFNLSAVDAAQCHSFLTWGHVETHLFTLTVLESYSVFHKSPQQLNFFAKQLYYFSHHELIRWHYWWIPVVDNRLICSSKSISFFFFGSIMNYILFLFIFFFF